MPGGETVVASFGDVTVSAGAHFALLKEHPRKWESLLILEVQTLHAEHAPSSTSALVTHVHGYIGLLHPGANSVRSDVR